MAEVSESGKAPGLWKRWEGHHLEMFGWIGVLIGLFVVLPAGLVWLFVLY